jgi:hypothetical protein
MKVSDVYQGDYLKAADLQRPVRVTIREVAIKVFKDQQTQEEQRKIVLGFVGAKKEMVLNKTQAKAIAAAVGTDTIDEWAGKAIILSATTAHTGAATILVSPLVTEQENGGDPLAGGQPE